MIKLSLILLLVISASANCPTNSDISGLQAGSLELISFSTNNIFTHNFARRFQSAPEIAIGILDLGFNGSNDPDLNHFNIGTTSVNPSQAVFGLQPQKSGSWEKIRINFWASARQDVIVGSAHTNLGSLQGSTVTKSVSTKNIPNHQISILRPLINGVSFNSGSTEIDLHIDGNSVKSNQIQFTVIVGRNSNIKQIWISYIVFAPSAIPFASYGGLSAQIGFQGIIHSNVHTIIHQTDYILAGLSKFRAPLNEPFIFKSNIDHDFVLTYEAKGNTIDFFLTYLIFGIPPGKLCTDCPDNLAFQSKCVRSCSIDSYPFTYRDQGRGCRRCSSKLNQFLNADRSGCVEGSAPAQTNQQSSTTFNPAVAPTTPPKSAMQETREKCKNQPNTYWTGYRCACRAGYFASRVSGTCEKIVITFPKPKRPILPKCSDTQFFNGVKCQCLPKHTRNSLGVCIIDTTIACPNFSTFVNGSCVCRAGYKKQGQICILDVLECPANMIDNGDKKCVCKSGYYLDDNKCVAGKPCPANSIRLSNGQCQCNDGYQINQIGLCSRCPQGSVWEDSKCVIPCGINQIYDYGIRKCVCKTGYGVLDGICEKCSGEYFLADGYCVTCPINSDYSEQKSKCQCKSGYEQSQGLCTQKCNENEIYFAPTSQCRCFSGLGRVNGQCQVCPGGSSPNPDTEECSGCLANSRLDNGKCICLPGYGININGECIRCQSVNLFLISGICGSCPNGRNWDGSSCVCPAGTDEINGNCIQKCLSSQLVDANGLCYYCPLNEVPVDGACQCQSGYTRNAATQRCEIKCKVNQVVVNGICASCSLGSVYDSIRRICVCPPGHYRNNFQFCEKSNPIPITCEPGQYYVENEGCRSCPIGCSTCESQNKCLTCFGIGFIPNGGQCVPECGDGKIVFGTQTCDDGNKRSGDGCSSACQSEPNYRCLGQPSVCQNLAPSPTPTPSSCGNGQINANEDCDDGNSANGDGCSSVCKVESGYSCDQGKPSICSRAATNIKKVGNVINNSAAVYVTIETTPTFTFNNEEQMKNFIKYEFSSGALPSSAYCYQKISSPAFFDCVFFYPSGVPIAPFLIELSFSKDGNSGYIGIPVDTSKSVFAMRSLH